MRKYTSPEIKEVHIHCPVNGWDCPYYSDARFPCECTLKNPYRECDDFASMWDEDDDWECDDEHKPIDEEDE